MIHACDSPTRTVLAAAGRQRFAGKRLSERALLAEWRSVDRRRDEVVRSGTESVASVYRAAAREVVGRLRDELVVPRRSLWIAAKQDNDLLSELVFDISKWNDELQEALDPELLAAVRQGFETGALRIDISGTVDVSQQRVQDVLRRTINDSVIANENLRERIARDIGEGMEAQETLDEITQRITDRFENMQTWRARQIAQTAITPTFEQGQSEAFFRAEIERHAWLSQRDDAVRPDHWDADGQTVGIDERFIVGGESALYPGDTLLSLAQRINCRCTRRPIID